ncbi:hypothetical protein DYQ86_25895 [Acidobacteria bacterium AB60]|nr:hypothetical protein DYQ86_25895 [Acidobacteria bacterium AB60]
MKAAALAVALLLSVLCLAAQDPIRLDPKNPHHFQYDGKTIALLTSGEHYGSVINPDFNYHKYLDALQADGLNETRLFPGSYVEVPGTSFGIKRNTIAPPGDRILLPWARSAEPGYAGGGNKFDLTQWDSHYFARLHDFLQDAQHHGVIVEISLFSSQYGEVQWKVSPFNASNNINHTTEGLDLKHVNTLQNGNVLALQERYVRKLVHELNSFPNIIFELQNEPWSDHPQLESVINPYLFTGRDQYPNSVEVADLDSLAWQSRVAQWITSEEAQLPHRHLIAQNYSNFRLPVRQLIDGVSVVNFHYAYPEAVTLNYGLNKAIAYDETGFLGRSDDAYRRQAWNFMLAGGSAFDSLDYSFTVGFENGTDTEPNGPGGGSPALRKQLGFLQRFLSALPLVDMHPDYNVVVHAAGAATHALSDGKGVFAIYLDGKGPSSLALRLPSGNYRGEWINVVTGEANAVTNLSSSGDETSIKVPEFESGIALRLSRALY